MNKKNDILLSVCMVSYNQEQYVRDALDSILMQKTDFAYEVIISDDCSKDKTVEILNEYAAKNHVGPKNVAQNIGQSASNQQTTQ